jgi:hypothetical protein
VTWVQTLFLVAGVLTVVNLAIYFMFGSDVHAMGLVFLISRFPGHAGATCVVYYLDPIGPWPGVCDRACRNPPGHMGTDLVGACYLMAGVDRE